MESSLVTSVAWLFWPIWINNFEDIMELWESTVEHWSYWPVCRVLSAGTLDTTDMWILHPPDCSSRRTYQLQLFCQWSSNAISFELDASWDHNILPWNSLESIETLLDPWPAV
jgi:hypothetical protein